MRIKKLFIFFITFVTTLFCITGCSKDESKNSSKKLRDPSPQLYIPSTDYQITDQENNVSIDASHASSGYIMINYSGDNQKVKIQITSPDQVDYTYPVTVLNQFITYPLPGGNGPYKITVLESVDINKNLYATCFSKQINVSLENEYLPFLYANYYIYFDKDSKCVQKAQELAKDCYSSIDVITNVYNYVIKNIKYDKNKANNVQYGYIPHPDQTLKEKSGICFDYASLTSAMLRSQGIPTKLEVGYVGEVYHAWISCYVDEVGWVDDIIEFDGKDWSLLDPTLGANNSSKDVKKYIGDGSKYIVKYTY